MDRLIVLQDAIERAATAGRRYTAYQHVADVPSDEMRLIAGDERHAWLTGALQRALVLIAEQHAGCRQVGCGTCQEISNGLGMSLMGLRLMQEHELEGRLDG